MVYYRYIEEYGPYAYASVRSGTKVESIYICPVSVALATATSTKVYHIEKHKKSERVVRDPRTLKRMLEKAGTKFTFKTLTQDAVLKAHEAAIKEFGGEEGVINMGAIDFALVQVRNTRGVYKKSARLLIGLIRGHPFVDGNKRTALQASADLLELNDKKFAVGDTMQAGHFINEIAEDKKSLDEVIKWLKKQTKQTLRKSSPS